MDFRVLGPLLVSRDGVDLEVRGAKERTLLAHLVAYAGQVVSVGALIEALWGDEPPRSAAKTLQTYVLRLRNTLEPDRDGTPRVLVTGGNGYRLAIGASDVDAGRFGRLVELAREALAGGRPETALEFSGDALALWRGPAYAGCEDTAFGRAEVRRLTELRLAAAEIRAEARLQLGQASAAAAELERLVGEHPLRERLWELLMLAQCLSGHQAQALATYERVREVLADELGVDPGDALRGLFARVLAQDPGLRPAPPRAVVPAGLCDRTPMVGRTGELRALREAWQRTLSGMPQTVVVRGPAGAGASRLAAALAEEVVDDGAQVTDDPTATYAEPWLLVTDTAVERPGTAMLLRLTRPGTAVPDGAAVIDLVPLGRYDVRRIVAGYVAAEQIETVTEDVLSSGPAWPGRVHAAAARAARTAATQRVADAIGVAGDTSARLSSARAEMSEGIISLGEASDVARTSEPGTCPWRGLAAYSVEDSPWFAGREHLVAELLARLATTRLLAVVGASGSGKSSVLRAGLLAALREDVLPGSAAWRQVLMRPGRHPMRELARAAMGAQPTEPGELLAHLIRTEDTAPRTLLVIDQMEEVWTACDDPGERAAFLDTLVELLADPRSTTTVVLAVRADYVAEVAEHPALASLMADGTVLVGSPTPAEIERAVTRPAARAGLALEEGLARTVVDDAGTEPGLLPLLSVALTQLWELRQGDRLTYAGYVAVGGIAGAIGTLAEEVWAGLSDTERDVARVLLLRLTGPGEGTGVVRRRVPLVEIEALSLTGLRAVLTRLAEARLVTVSDAHVEVAHEALFREWPRLRGWLTDEAAGRAVQRRLAMAASEWDAEGREPAALWRGTRLLSGLEVASARPDEITHVERAFLDAGREAAEREEGQVREHAAATARQNRRLRFLLVGTAGFLVIALVAGVLALRARASAEESAAEAGAARVSAEAKRLAADALNEDRPALGLLEAVEAIRRERSPETYGALLTLLTRSPDIATRYRIEGRFLRIGAGTDGSTVYLADNGDLLHALDAVTGEQLWRADSPGESQWGTPATDPQGRWVAVPVVAAGEVALSFLDPSTGEPLRTVPASALARAAPGGSPWLDESAHVLGDDVVITSETHLFVVDPNTGRVVRALPFGRHSPFTTLLPGGRLAAEVDELQTRVIDVRTGRQRVFEDFIVGVSDDGDRVVTSIASSSPTGGESSELQVRDADWRPVGEAVRLPGFVRRAVFLPGDGLAVARDEVVEVYDARTLEFRRALEGHSGAVLGIVRAGPDGDLLWTAGRDGTAVAFDLSGTRGLLRTRPLGVPANAGTATADVGLFVPQYDDRLNPLRMMDLATGRDLHGEIDVPGCHCQPTSVALTPDGALAVVGTMEFTEEFDVVADRGRVMVWDTASGTRVRTIPTPWEATGVAVTPDGEQVVVNGSGGWGLWDVGTGRRVWAHEKPADSEDLSTLVGAAGMTAVSPDGRHITLARGEEVLLVDAASGEVRRSARLPGSRALSDVTWSADGASVVLGSMTGRLYFLDGRTLRRVAPDRLVTPGFVLDLAISPDGAMLAVMGSDGDVTLFDTATWRPYGKPIMDGLGWGFLSFTEDTLRVFGEYGPAREIDLDPAAWVEAGCRVANTEFTAEEAAVVLPGEPVRPTCT